MLLPQGLLFCLTTYDLVSHGISTSDGECRGAYSSTSGIGYGAGYVNSCIHSGTNAALTTDTVWYNYVTASAGTITNKDASDTTGNFNVATENVCPKGWTLPSAKQIDSNKSVSIFTPVLGGNYTNGNLNSQDTLGVWWSSDAEVSSARYIMDYKGADSALIISYNSRRTGFYIRCVSEEKTVTDLTYMQDMTPSIAD